MIRRVLKRISFLSLFFIFISLLFSCGEGNGNNSSGIQRFRDTTGPVNMITVVVDTAVYRQLYPFLRQPSVLGEQLPATLIPQSLFGFRNFTPNEFEKRNATRIVINVKKGEPNFTSQPSRYAKHQAYFEVYGNTLGDVENQIQQHREEIISEAKRANFGFLSDRMENDHAKDLSQMGLYMKIPAQYELVQESPEYQWYRLDKIETLTARIGDTSSKIGTQDVENFNIQIVEGPMDKDSLTIAEISTIVNAYGLNKLKGENENDYLTIQQDFIDVEPALMTNNYVLYDFDGMWEMKNEYFGGSFLGRIIIQKKEKKFDMALISINAPNPKNKRNNVLHALSMVKSFKILKEEK